MADDPKDKSPDDQSTDGLLPDFIPNEGIAEGGEESEAKADAPQETTDAPTPADADEGGGQDDDEIAAMEAKLKALKKARLQKQIEDEQRALEGDTGDAAPAEADSAPAEEAKPKEETSAEEPKGKKKKGKKGKKGKKDKEEAVAAATKAKPVAPLDPLDPMQENIAGIAGVLLPDEEADSIIDESDREKIRQRRIDVVMDDDIDDLDGPSPETKSGSVLFIVALVLFVAGLVFVFIDADRRAQVFAFFSGEIAQQKAQARQAEEAKWKKLMAATKNKYGDLTFQFYPEDTKLVIQQMVYTQQGLEGEKQGPTFSTIPNPTENLKENQKVKMPVVIPNVPLFETQLPWDDEKGGGKDDKGVPDDIPEDFNESQIKAFTYQYKLFLSREGYEPREVELNADLCEQKGPNMNCMFPPMAFDLMPEPETMKNNYVAFMKDYYCLMLKFKDPKELKENATEFMVQHKFKTWGDFEKIQASLQSGENEEWWKETWAGIQKDVKCEDGAQVE